jgi:hypothetical protein
MVFESIFDIKDVTTIHRSKININLLKNTTLNIIG